MAANEGQAARLRGSNWKETGYGLSPAALLGAITGFQGESRGRSAGKQPPAGADSSGCAVACWAAPPPRSCSDDSTPGRSLEGAILSITHREGLTGSPRSFAGYPVDVDKSRLPAGMEVLAQRPHLWVSRIFSSSATSAVPSAPSPRSGTSARASIGYRRPALASGIDLGGSVVDGSGRPRTQCQPVSGLRNLAAGALHRASTVTEQQFRRQETHPPRPQPLP